MDKEQEARPSTSSKQLATTKRRKEGLVIVIKVGSSSIINSKNLQIRLALLSKLVETIIALKDLGHKIVLVSSGAVAVGMRRLGISARPLAVHGVQAVAAAGQGRLMALYDDLFGQFDLPIAQILLTKDNLADVSNKHLANSSARNT
jgi:glutamate 5-kinase